MRKMLAILGLATLFVVLAQPAMGIGWGPESTWYDGKKRATGFGDFRNDGNVRAENAIIVTDDDDDGNAVYGVTEFYFHYRECGMETAYECADDFHRRGQRKTQEFKNRKLEFHHKMDLLPTASRVRAKTFACVQMGWPVPDGCAAAAYPTFDY